MTQPMQPYMRIVKDLQASIRSEELATDEKLPSARELAERYDVATGTVQRALTQLKSDGWVYSHQGLGSFVRGIPVEDAGSNPDVARLQTRVETLETRVSALEEELASLRQAAQS